MTILEAARKNGFNASRFGEALSVWDVRNGSEVWVIWQTSLGEGFECGMCHFRGQLHWFETIERRRVGFDNAGEPLITLINVIVAIPESEQEEADRRHEIYRHRADPSAFEKLQATWTSQDFSQGHIVAWWGDSQFYEDDLAASSVRIDDSLNG